MVIDIYMQMMSIMLKNMIITIYNDIDDKNDNLCVGGLLPASVAACSSAA